jgi:hypothetical protein
MDMAFLGSMAEVNEETLQQALRAMQMVSIEANDADEAAEEIETEAVAV